MTVAESKEFKVKDDDTKYYLKKCLTGDYFVWWYDEDKVYKEVDYTPEIVKQHFDSENWKFVEGSSIARPILEERKIGKVQMDLFDQGFPNAVFEVAKVMTWAAENKGYKPHDWKSLPNAETEFSAAASRHRVKGFIQKAEGIAAIDRTDEESNIVHLAHTAFNILAELELVLTGKIK